MFLYRVIFGHDFKENGFCVPKIPLGGPGEDNTIPRICTATSIEGCLNSLGVPFIGQKAMSEAAQKYQAKHPGEDLDMVKIWRSTVYPFTLLLFWVSDDDPNILTTERIKDKVIDAEATGECWILNRRKPTSIKKVWLYDAYVSDVKITTDDGKAFRMFKMQNPIWSESKTSPTIGMVAQIKYAFEKAEKQFQERGFDI